MEYLKKEGRHEVHFLHADKQTFQHADTINIGSMASLAESTKNYEFVKPFQYLEKEVRDKVDLCTDKHQSIQRVGTVISDGCSQACLKSSK